MDQVYRPENDYHLKSRKANHNRCRFCCCIFLGVLISLILLVGILIGISTAVIYRVFRPLPDYSIDSISIKNFNLSSSSPISPEFDVTVSADKIGIYYLKGSSVSVFHKETELSTGALPVFLQGKSNVTVFTAVLKGTGVEVTRGLAGEAHRGAVALRVDMRVPMRVVSVVKTLKITWSVECGITVDKLTADAKILSEKCGYCFPLPHPFFSCGIY